MSSIRSIHFLAACISLLPLTSTAALFAKTSNTIQGTHPTLSDSLETEITSSKFSLLGFQYNGTDYYPTNIDSLSGFSATITPSTLISSLTPAIQQLTASDAHDDNGDSNIQLLAKTVITQKILDANNVDISASTASFCDLMESNPGPYQLALSGDLLLKTQYGDPREQEYSVNNEFIGHQPQNSYTVPIAPTICYLQPELDSNYGTSNASIWKPTKGFLPQSDTQPTKNFPTTGFTGASFNIKVSGFDAQVDGANWEAHIMTGENMGAYATATAADTVKVILVGPETLAGIVAAFHGPAIVKITNDLNDLTYSFEISKWFIHDNRQPYEFDDAQYACMSSQANVRLPTITELTNGVKGTGYTRAIGEGVLSEWGNPSKYSEFYWDASNYSWTSEVDPTIYGSHYSVLPISGLVASTNDTNRIFATCVSR